MFRVVVDLFIVVMWGVALIFLILTLVFIKRKIERWIFGILTVLFGIIPFLLFYMFSKNQVDQQERFIGQFSNETTDNFIELKEDLTWKSDNDLFDCTAGTWKFVVTEDKSYLELTGHCDSTHTFLQILNCTPDLLTFSPHQNTGDTKSKIELKRRY